MAKITNLTPRELEILQLMIMGKTIKAIANDIFIIAKRVEIHLDHIYRADCAPTISMPFAYALTTARGSGLKRQLRVNVAKLRQCIRT